MLDNHRWQFPCTGMWSSWFVSCISIRTIAIEFFLIKIIFCRTMSLVRSHAYSGKNFFFVIVRFLETFVGSLSAGYLSLTLSLNNLLLLLSSKSIVCYTSRELVRSNALISLGTLEDTAINSSWCRVSWYVTAIKNLLLIIWMSVSVQLILILISLLISWAVI